MGNMFIFEKRTQMPVRIKNKNPKLAGFILSQYGGPDGELGASLRYLSQRFTMPDNCVLTYYQCSQTPS
jgi:spore coat protein JC